MAQYDDIRIPLQSIATAFEQITGGDKQPDYAYETFECPNCGVRRSIQFDLTKTSRTIVCEPTEDCEQACGESYLIYYNTGIRLVKLFSINDIPFADFNKGLESR